MKNRKPLFNPKQRAIIQTLNKTRYGLTPYEISRQTGISWITVKKHINTLERRKIVSCPKSKLKSVNPKKLCKLNFDLIYGKRK